MLTRPRNRSELGETALNDRTDQMESMNKNWEVELSADHPNYIEIIQRATTVTQRGLRQESFSVEKLLQIDDIEQVMEEILRLREETATIMLQAEPLSQLADDKLLIHLVEIHTNLKAAIRLSQQLDQVNQGLKDYSSILRGGMLQLVARLNETLKDLDDSNSQENC